MIRINPDKLWQFFCDHIFRLKYDEYVLAETDGGLTISLMSTQDYEPALSVDRNGSMVAFYVVDETNLAKTAEMLYDLYCEDKGNLGEEEQDEPDEPDDAVDEKDAEIQISEEEIEEREHDLEMGLRDFLDVVIEDDAAYKDDIEDLLNDVLATISSYGYPVRRPMIVEYVDGTEELTLYPYAE